MQLLLNLIIWWHAFLSRERYNWNAFGAAIQGNRFSSIFIPTKIFFYRVREGCDGTPTRTVTALIWPGWLKFSSLLFVFLFGRRFRLPFCPWTSFPVFLSPSPSHGHRSNPPSLSDPFFLARSSKKGRKESFRPIEESVILARRAGSETLKAFLVLAASASQVKDSSRHFFPVDDFWFSSEIVTFGLALNWILSRGRHKNPLILVVNSRNRGRLCSWSCSGRFLIFIFLKLVSFLRAIWWLYSGDLKPNLLSDNPGFLLWIMFVWYCSHDTGPSCYRFVGNV